MISDIDNETQITELTTRSIFHDGFTSVIFVSKIKSPNGDDIPVSDLPAGLSSRLPRITYEEKACLIKSQLLANIEFHNLDELKAALNDNGIDENAVLALNNETQQYIYSSIIISGSPNDPVTSYSIYGDIFTKQTIIFPEAKNSRLPASHAKLEEMKIGIVGLGSLGSKIAVSLARSGFLKFTLIDDDYLIAENICRNELSWQYVGVHKSVAVKEKLLLINSNMEVASHTGRLVGQESSMLNATMLNELSKCDVLIDATANPDVFLTLAGIAKKNSIGLFWGEVYAGGIGGIVARSRPNLDPTPIEVRNGIWNFYNGLPDAPNKAAIGYDVDAEVPMVAYDSEVTQIAAALTQMVIDFVTSTEEPSSAASAYIIGFKYYKGWFNEPFETYSVNLEVGSEKWGEEPQSMTDEESKNFGQLLTEMLESQNADSNSPT
jgi:hypothetical protein